MDSIPISPWCGSQGILVDIRGLCRFWARVLGHVFHQIATNLIDGCGWFVIDSAGWNLIVAKHRRKERACLDCQDHAGPGGHRREVRQLDQISDME